MVVLRRFLVIAALMFWQGGFTFYASVVVPVGQSVLGSPSTQGMITRQVTNYMNLAGAVALVPLAWDIPATRMISRKAWICRWLCWSGMLVLLGWLFWLHGQMDQLLDVEELSRPQRHTFRLEHRIYLWVSTFQWLCALVYAIATLWSWRTEDRRASGAL